MNRGFTIAALVGLFGCGSRAPDVNPPQLWIAPNGSELALKLQPVEPEHF
jgi:hypothetical protein